jgi:probable HAF family extracellular repeat protein
MKYINNKFPLLITLTILTAYSNCIFSSSTGSIVDPDLKVMPIPIAMTGYDDGRIYDQGKNLTSMKDDYTFSTIIFSGRSKIGHRLLRDLKVNTASTDRRDNSDMVILNRSINEDDNSLLSVQGRINKDPVSTDKSIKYFITDMGTLGGTESFAYGISDSEEVIGSSRLIGDTETHSFLYSKGKIKDLYPLNSESIQTVGPSSINGGEIASGVINNGIYYPAIYSIKTSKITILDSLGGITPYNFNGVATSINKSGQAVGYSYIDYINRHAFLYSNGAVTDIGSFGGYSGATAINNKGRIVGFASGPDNGRAHAFFYLNGVMKDIDPVAPLDFSKSESYARDINNNGDVVGEFLTKDQSAFHGFLYSNGVFTDLGSKNSPETVPFGINDLRQIVGVKYSPYNDVCYDPNVGFVPCIKFEAHAFFYDKKKLVDLNTLIRPNSDWKLSWAFDINNNGQIVGYGLVNDKFRAFLLTPATNERQCKGDGWKIYGFNHQNACIMFVKTGK